MDSNAVQIGREHGLLGEEYVQYLEAVTLYADWVNAVLKPETAETANDLRTAVNRTQEILQGNVQSAFRQYLITQSPLK